MNSTFRTLMTAALLTSSSAALAEPFTVALGETKVLTLSQRVSSVQVEDGSFVDVRRMGRGTSVAVVGKSLGKTDLTLRTYRGDVVTLTFNVTSEGARAFTAERRAARMTLSTPELESVEPRNNEPASEGSGPVAAAAPLD